MLAILGDDDDDNDESICRLAVNKRLGNTGIRGTDNNLSEEFDEEFQDISFNEDITSTSSTIRKFNLPKLNIHANTYYPWSNLNLEVMKEPPTLKDLTNTKIEAFQESKINTGRLIP